MAESDANQLIDAKKRGHSTFPPRHRLALGRQTATRPLSTSSDRKSGHRKFSCISTKSTASRFPFILHFSSPRPPRSERSSSKCGRLRRVRLLGLGFGLRMRDWTLSSTRRVRWPAQVRPGPPVGVPSPRLSVARPRLKTCPLPSRRLHEPNSPLFETVRLAKSQGDCEFR